MHFYFVTLKRMSYSFTSIRDITDLYSQLFDDHATTLSFAIELDSLYRLHSHSLILLDFVPHYKQYQVTGWRVHLCPVLLTNLDRVDTYIHKNQDPTYVNEMEWFSQSQFHYMFI